MSYQKGRSKERLLGRKQEDGCTCVHSAIGSKIRSGVPPLPFVRLCSAQVPQHQHIALKNLSVDYLEDGSWQLDFFPLQHYFLIRYHGSLTVGGLHGDGVLIFWEVDKRAA